MLHVDRSPNRRCLVLGFAAAVASPTVPALAVITSPAPATMPTIADLYATWSAAWAAIEADPDAPWPLSGGELHAMADAILAARPTSPAEAAAKLRFAKASVRQLMDSDEPEDFADKIVFAAVDEALTFLEGGSANG